MREFVVSIFADEAYTNRHRPVVFVRSQEETCYAADRSIWTCEKVGPLCAQCDLRELRDPVKGGRPTL
jgi:hypothetical protein